MRHLTLCILLLTTVGYAQDKDPQSARALPYFPPDMMAESNHLRLPNRNLRSPFRTGFFVKRTKFTRSGIPARVTGRGLCALTIIAVLTRID